MYDWHADCQKWPTQQLNLFTPVNHFLNFLEEIVVCWWPRIIHFPFVVQYEITTGGNDHTIGWQKLNLLCHPNATLAPQARQARASGENLNYVTLAP